MKTMRFLAAFMICFLALPCCTTSVYGDNICPLFPIDESNADQGYWSYYGDICPGHGADLFDGPTNLPDESCKTCDPAPAMCGPDCVDYSRACQGKGEKLRRGAIAKKPPVLAKGKNKPHKPHTLSKPKHATVTDVLKNPLFVKFTLPSKAVIYAQLYRIDAVPDDETIHPRMIFGTGHEIDDTMLTKDEKKQADLNEVTRSLGIVPTVTNSVYHVSFQGVDYQVITTAQP